jgi:ribonuclease P protein component
LSRRGGADEAQIVRLRHRSEFLAAARGARAVRDAFVLQGIRRLDPERADSVGVGLTVTKKIGTAVVRNRARRRLREALRLMLPGPALPGHDYVVVARAAALTREFAALRDDLVGAFAQLGRRLQRGGT